MAWPGNPEVLGSGDGCIYDLAKGGPQFGASDLIVGRPKAATMGGFTGPDTEDTISAQGDLRTATSSPGSSTSATRLGRRPR